MSSWHVVPSKPALSDSVGQYQGQGPDMISYALAGSIPGKNHSEKLADAALQTAMLCDCSNFHDFEIQGKQAHFWTSRTFA